MGESQDSGASLNIVCQIQGESSFGPSRPASSARGEPTTDLRGEWCPEGASRREDPGDAVHVGLSQIINYLTLSYVR